MQDAFNWMTIMELPGLRTSRPGAGLADAIYETLSEAIIRGSLPAGYRLREIALSKHFDVSTTPVRDALRRLDYEGLVEINPRRGAVVTTVDRLQLRDLYEIRELLECHALSRAGERESPDLLRLDELLLESEPVAQSDDYARFSKLDLGFHSHLTALGGNEELRVLAEQTHRRIQAVRMRNAVNLPGQQKTSHEEHVRIIDFLRRGDTAGAVEQLRLHIGSVRDAVMRSDESSG